MEDDLVGVAGLGREPALQQIDGPLRAGARKREATRRLLSDGARNREDPDRGRDPGDDDEAAVGHCPASDVHHGCPIFRDG